MKANALRRLNDKILNASFVVCFALNRVACLIGLAFFSRADVINMACNDKNHLMGVFKGSFEGERGSSVSST